MCIRFIMASMILALASSGPAWADAPSDRRIILERASPTAYEALRRLENHRGAPFSDAELDDVLRSKSFAIEHEAATRRFCAKASNANNLACL